MTTWRLPIVIVAFALSVAVGSQAQTEGLMASGEAAVVQKTSAPKIQFADPVFDFGKIAAGTVVKHSYVFTNTGTAPLMVTGVYPSCGCTTAEEWSARLEAGQTGMVPIQFASAGFDGAINKWIMVASNDPDQPEVVLALKGMVWIPIDVTPANAVFTPVADTPASETKVIHITNNTEEPLILSAPENTNRAFRVALKTVRPEKEFELRVTTVPPFGAGTVRGSITIKTNSSQVPVITVTALAVVQEPVTALPTEIRLRGGPLPSNIPTWVSVRNNSGTAGFAVFDPVVDLPGVTAVVKEVEAGRVFSVLLTFPAGFELQPGSQAELRVKTTHPQFPVITVPIHQDPRRIRAQANRPAADRQPNPPPTGVAAPKMETLSPAAKPTPVDAPK